jgi:hypothetical protein
MKLWQKAIFSVSVSIIVKSIAVAVHFFSPIDKKTRPPKQLQTMMVFQ